MQAFIFNAQPEGEKVKISIDAGEKGKVEMLVNVADASEMAIAIISAAVRTPSSLTYAVSSKSE